MNYNYSVIHLILCLTYNVFQSTNTLTNWQPAIKTKPKQIVIWPSDNKYTTRRGQSTSISRMPARCNLRRTVNTRTENSKTHRGTRKHQNCDSFAKTRSVMRQGHRQRCRNAIFLLSKTAVEKENKNTPRYELGQMKRSSACRKANAWISTASWCTESRTHRRRTRASHYVTLYGT